MTTLLSAVSLPLPMTALPSVCSDGALARLNLFDGRLLTAASLTLEQRYQDARDRLLAQVNTCGVAWGLIVHPADRTKLAPFAPDDAFELSPGLAFDGNGRPLRVATKITFTVKSLLDAYHRQAFEVVTTTSPLGFHRCIDARPASDDSILSGAYLLAAKVEDTPSAARAQVISPGCPDPTTPACVQDAWCERACLYLLRLRIPHGVPEDQLDAWSLRGLYTAAWFDLFERPLSRRFPSGFPSDVAAWLGPPAPEGESWVPLALFYYRNGTQAQVLVADTHIPRRPILGTVGASWSKQLVGAQSPEAALARVLQFQTQLADSARTGSPDRNLLQRGFWHIPPVGYLPIQDAEGKLAGAKAPLDSLVAVEKARKAADVFFRGTNVLVLDVVALHEDDVHEAIAESIDKDPLVLAPQPARFDPKLLRLFDTFLTEIQVTPATSTAAQPFKQTYYSNTVDTMLSPQGTPAVATYDGNVAWQNVKRALAPAAWLWSSYYVGDPTVDQTQAFEWKITIPPNVSALTAKLNVAVDNFLKLFVNGVPVPIAGVGFDKATPVQLNLQIGAVNVLRWEVTNHGEAGLKSVFRDDALHNTHVAAETNPGGLIWTLEVGYQPPPIVTGPTYKDHAIFVSPYRAGWLPEIGRPLIRFLLRGGFDLAQQLLERTIEPVRLIVPLDAPNRSFPFVGPVHARASLTAGAQDYAAYVKQRLILPAWTFSAARLAAFFDGILSAGGAASHTPLWTALRDLRGLAMTGTIDEAQVKAKISDASWAGLRDDVIALLKEIGSEGLSTFLFELDQLVGPA